MQEMVTADELEGDARVWEPRAIPLSGGRYPMPDTVRAGEYDSDQPCPDPGCPASSTLSLELVAGRVRMVCACGIAGAWADDDEGANKNWDQLPRGVTDG
jgi:hypothetical protein